MVYFMMASRYDIRNAYYKQSGRVALIADNEGTTSLPEYSPLPPDTDTRYTILDMYKNISSIL